jgi:hypothetical protein
MKTGSSTGRVGVHPTASFPTYSYRKKVVKEGRKKGMKGNEGIGTKELVGSGKLVGGEGIRT